MAGSPACTLLAHIDQPVQSENDLMKALESKKDSEVIEALKNVILFTLNGESFPRLLMSVIKYCLHSENHTVKKLIILYWEVVKKTDDEGALLPQMILVCNAMKNNLMHPNEYIRGITLRFLCKMKSPEILESLIPSITANLEHRHSYVRKNAVLTIFSICADFPDLIPDACERVEELLYAEANPSAKRNAFLMLLHCDVDRAVAFLGTMMSTVQQVGESFQLVVLELIRKVCRANPLIKSQFIRCIYNLVNSPSPAVAFEAANTMCALSTAPTAIRAVVSAYCQLLQSESDNNVKLIILDRLASLRKRKQKLMEDMLMDVLRTLSSPNLDIRKKTLDLALGLVSPRNVDEVLQVLRKEMVLTEKQDGAKKGQQEQYRRMLVEALHSLAVKFPNVVGQIVQILLNYLSDESGSSGMGVVLFVREIAQEYPDLRGEILSKLTESMGEIRCSQVYRVALWVLGEFCRELPLIEEALEAIYEAVGPVPFNTAAAAAAAEGEEKEDGAEGTTTTAAAVTGPAVLADGTYASQATASAAVTSSELDGEGGPKSHLRAMLVEGSDFLSASLANCLTKLSVRVARLQGESEATNRMCAKAMLVLVACLNPSGRGKGSPLDQDSFRRITQCIRTLLDPFGDDAQMFESGSGAAFAAMLETNRPDSAEDKKKVELVTQADDIVSIRQLKTGSGSGLNNDLEDDEGDLVKALGSGNYVDATTKELNRVYQLTGFADEVYVEATLKVLGYDIVLDITVVNQTPKVIQNLAVELTASGDLKVVERPQMHTIQAYGATKVTSHVKVSNTESGVIFGNVVFDAASGSQQRAVPLNNIHMDIMDYIAPATTTNQEFRRMWSEFEWENKVAVNTDCEDLNEYLAHVVSITNMAVLTPTTADQDCTFLAANLFARSMFNEDALLNLSIEKQDSGKIAGYVRIRSKTQGIALALGEKVTRAKEV